MGVGLAGNTNNPSTRSKTEDHPVAEPAKGSGVYFQRKIPKPKHSKQNRTYPKNTLETTTSLRVTWIVTPGRQTTR